MHPRAVAVALLFQCKSVACPRCQRLSETYPICSFCARLVELPLGWNHFQILGFEPHWLMDPQDLKERHRWLAGLVHPDRYAAAGSPDSLYALRWTIALNTAMRVLQDSSERTRYFLSLEGLNVEHAKGEVPVDLAEIYFEIDDAGPAEVTCFRERLQHELVDCARRYTELSVRWTGQKDPAVLKDLHSTWVRERYLGSMMESLSQKQVLGAS